MCMILRSNKNSDSSICSSWREELPFFFKLKLGIFSISVYRQSYWISFGQHFLHLFIYNLISSAASGFLGWGGGEGKYTYTYVSMYICEFIYVCVIHTHTHTHTHINILFSTHIHILFSLESPWISAPWTAPPTPTPPLSKLNFWQ